MADDNEIAPPQFDENAKWDACLDLTVRRLVYSSVAGAFTGLLLFRSPVSRWASIAFGAGCGIGSAYTDCSRIFDSTSSKSSFSKISEATNHQSQHVLEFRAMGGALGDEMT